MDSGANKTAVEVIIMMLVLINLVLNAEHRYDFGKMNVGLLKQTLMVGFSGILDAGQVEDQKMLKEKLLDGKEL